MKKILLILALLISFCQASKVLKPDEAFKLSFTQKNDKVLLDFKLGKDIYIYKDKLNITVDGQKINPNLPKATKEHGLEVFSNNLTLTVPLKKDNSKLQVSWQGCSKSGICYPPMEKNIKLEKQSLNQADSIAQDISKDGFFWTILTFFGYGVLLSFTPCVFPMIPILSSIIVSRKNLSSKGGFWLSFVYVFFMSLAYGISGVLAGLFGSNLQTSLQNPTVIIIFALIFVALALSMFGFYEIELPKSIQNRISSRSQNMQNKGIVGVAIMGFLSALIVGPCVAAPLAGALVYISQSGDALLGGLALFAMGFGSGVLLLIIGASAGKILPKPGVWMNRVKAVFGVIMLLMAVYMLQRILSPEIAMLLYSIIFISSSIYSGVFEQITQADSYQKALKSFSFILLLYGILVFVGSFIGGGNLTSPLKGLRQNSLATYDKGKFTKIKNLTELQNRLKEAKKPVIVDFWANWCENCKKYDDVTLADERVKKNLKDFLFIKIDITKTTKENKELLAHFNLFGPPAMVFFKNNKEFKELKTVGFKAPDEFLDILSKAKL